jgi:cytochrome c553
VGGGGAAVGGANNGGASGGTQSTGGSTQEMGGSGGMQSLGGNGGTPPKPDTEISLQVACDPQAEAMPDLNEILALKADPNRGSAAYLNACSFCHTSGGDGKTLETGVKVPPLKGIPWTCKQVLTLRDGVPKTPMVSFAATHDAQWIADMIAHIQTNF